ncbi:GAP family protein [Nesterenkonia sp. K-15-9-6]|uniref:GAP family protein n=1 Tax=Nesterenkonia sp. K-15-9-6 TaxID=3093918 RepID=UPI004043E3A0
MSTTDILMPVLDRTWSAVSLSDLSGELPTDGLGAGLWGILAVLALIDSTTFGTLLIPVWLLMAPGRLRAGRVLVYLGVVAAGYAVIGVVLLASLTFFGDGLLSWFAEVRGTPVFLLGQALLGAALLAYSFHLDPMTRAGKARKARREQARGSAGRVTRWRARVLGTEVSPAPEAVTSPRAQTAAAPSSGQAGPSASESASESASASTSTSAVRPAGVGALVGLGLLAVLLEIGTVLPYLAGIGMVAATGPQWPASTVMILFYCLMMVLPALALLGGRLVAQRALQGPLEKLEGWLSRHAAGMVAWVVGGVGVLLLINALGSLDVL